MALKSSNQAKDGTVDADELLGDLEKLVDRLRVMYEQYFLGIQKAAPSHMHSDAERRIRDLTILQIRNTGQRYRLATLTQKFGSYNSYWKRTVRDIEAGRYIRDLSRIQRQAATSGEEIPEEVLAAMPKRMRQMIERDRKAANAAAGRRAATSSGTSTPPPANAANAPAVAAKPRSTTHALDEALLGDDFDIDAMFKNVASTTIPPPLATPRTRTGQRKRPTSNSDLMFPRTRTGNPARMGAPSTIPPPLTSAASRAAAPLYLTDDDDIVSAPPSRRAPTAAPPPTAPRAPTASPPFRTSPPPMPPRASTSSPPAARPIAAPAPAAPPPPGMSESETRALYAKYVKAREVVRDGSETMSYDLLVRHLRQQAPKIMEAHKSSGVEFGIVIKDNKIVIKAKPKS
ncbi:MAG: hypothetical protein IPL79_11695 [Myxococcales bacterium]|nr:hypothetical protein [Myxococcales bacterium]